MSNFSNLTAFIVDDEEVDLFISHRILKIKNLADTIEVFRDGQALLEAIAQGKKPDYILLNYRMPGKDGLEILDMLRATRSKIQEGNQCLVIITSSTAFSDDIELIEKHEGVGGFLAKPIVPAKLENILNSKKLSA